MAKMTLATEDNPIRELAMKGWSINQWNPMWLRADKTVPGVAHVYVGRNEKDYSTGKRPPAYVTVQTTPMKMTPEEAVELGNMICLTIKKFDNKRKARALA